MVTTALGACSLLFADASTTAVPAPGHGGQQGKDGGDGAPTVNVVECREPDAAAGCGVVVEARDFKRDGLGGDYHVSNVAITLQDTDVYAAVQGTSTVGAEETIANHGQTSWARWTAASTVAYSAFQNQEICSDSSSCIGTLHLSWLFAPSVVLSGACGVGFRDVKPLASEGSDRGYCVGSSAGDSADVWASLDGATSAVGAFIVGGQGEAVRHQHQHYRSLQTAS